VAVCRLIIDMSYRRDYLLRYFHQVPGALSPDSALINSGGRPDWPLGSERSTFRNGALAWRPGRRGIENGLGNPAPVQALNEPWSCYCDTVAAVAIFVVPRRLPLLLWNWWSLFSYIPDELRCVEIHELVYARTDVHRHIQTYRRISHAGRRA
jgi:hypothetical protein